MKKQLLIALMALASLLFIANGANAQYCSTFLPSCHWQEGAGIRAQQGNEELGATTSGTENQNAEMMSAAPSKEQAPVEFAPAGSSFNREDLKPGWVPHEEAPGESQPY